MRITTANLTLCSLLLLVLSSQGGGITASRPRLGVSMHPDVICATISVDCPEMTKVGSLVIFHAKVAQGTPIVTLGYRWKVSGGQIVSGQGTTSITVQTVHSRKSLIRATLKVLGIRKDCPATAQCSVELSRKKES